jgi:hypothetical protein
LTLQSASAKLRHQIPCRAWEKRITIEPLSLSPEILRNRTPDRVILSVELIFLKVLKEGRASLIWNPIDVIFKARTIPFQTGHFLLQFFDLRPESPNLLPGSDESDRPIEHGKAEKVATFLENHNPYHVFSRPVD